MEGDFKYFIYDLSSMTKFPKCLLDKIVSSLDFPSILKLSMACKAFYKASLPSLFRLITLNQSMSKEYLKFLGEKGLYVKELRIERFEDFLKFRGCDLSLSTTFPSLQSLYLNMEFVPESTNLEDLTNECNALSELKHLHIYGEKLRNGFLVCLKPLIKNLDSLYVEFYPYSLIECPNSFFGLKMLLMPLSEAEYIRNTPSDSDIPFEIALVDVHAPLISLKLEPSHSSIWLQYERYDLQLYFKLSADLRFEENICEIKDRRVENIFSNYYCSTDSCEKLEHITSVPNFIEHCAVVTFGKPNDFSLDHFVDVDSLDLNLSDVYDPHVLVRAKFKASKLSLAVDNEYFSVFFKWVVGSFPRLAHFYVDNTVSEEMLPLEKNIFPNLVHFYSNVEQPDSFWLKLVRAAPNLSCIHTDSVPSNLVEIEILNPNIQLMPYRNINGHDGNVYEIYSFIKHLDS